MFFGAFGAVIVILACSHRPRTIRKREAVSVSTDVTHCHILVVVIVVIITILIVLGIGTLASLRPPVPPSNYDLSPVPGPSWRT
jgi:ADP-ribosylglycohydrolase